MTTNCSSATDSVRRLSYWNANGFMQSKIPYQENWLALLSVILNPELEVDDAMFEFGIRPVKRGTTPQKCKERYDKIPRAYNPIAIVESLLAGMSQPEIAKMFKVKKQVVSMLNVAHITHKEPFRPIDIETYGKPGDWYYAIHSDKT